MMREKKFGKFVTGNLDQALLFGVAFELRGVPIADLSI